MAMEFLCLYGFTQDSRIIYLVKLVFNHKTLDFYKKLCYNLYSTINFTQRPEPFPVFRLCMELFLFTYNNL